MLWSQTPGAEIHPAGCVWLGKFLTPLLNLLICETEIVPTSEGYLGVQWGFNTCAWQTVKSLIHVSHCDYYSYSHSYMIRKRNSTGKISLRLCTRCSCWDGLLPVLLTWKLQQCHRSSYTPLMAFCRQKTRTRCGWVVLWEIWEYGQCLVCFCISRV